MLSNSSPYSSVSSRVTPCLPTYQSRGFDKGSAENLTRSDKLTSNWSSSLSDIGLNRSSSKADTRANSFRLSFSESGSKEPMQPRKLFRLSPLCQVTKRGHLTSLASLNSLNCFIPDFSATIPALSRSFSLRLSKHKAARFLSYALVKSSAFCGIVTLLLFLALIEAAILGFLTRPFFFFIVLGGAFGFIELLLAFLPAILVDYFFAIFCYLLLIIL